MKALLLLLLAVRVAGIDFPDSVQAGSERLVINGAGLRTVTLFKVKAYAVALYVRQPTTDPQAILQADQPKVVDMVFLRDVEAGEVADAMNNGVAKAAGPRAAELKPELVAFQRWLPNLKKGDRLVITYSPTGVWVTTSRQKAPFHGSALLGNSMVGAWIGPTARDHDLRDRMLGRTKAAA